MKNRLFSFLAKKSNPYFWFGMRQLLKTRSAFDSEVELEKVMDFVSCCKIPGDYAEFGVYQGRTFSAACFLGREKKLKMQYWAFDSFMGLPSAEAEFTPGEFTCDVESFQRNVKRNIGHLIDVHIVPGWYSESLVESNPLLKPLGPVAVAWIDCDLYVSTKPVLDFLTSRLQDGSVLCFDDWFHFKGRADLGEQKACSEWLERNPQIKLVHYNNFGWNGKSFIVRLN